MSHGLRSWFALVGGLLVLTLVIAALLAPWIAPYDPRALAGEALQPPSSRHLIGTNNIGQDLFSQLVWGARAALVVALGAATLAISVGAFVGVGAGLAGGLVDVVAMRVVDVVLAVPRLPLLILVAALVGPSRTNLVLAIGLTVWPVIARTVRSQAASLRERGFVAAAGGFGGGGLYVMRRHLLPAVGPLIVAGFVAVSGQAVLLETGLAFLGLADPTAVSWGLILNRALAHPGLYFSPLWTWWVLPAGLAITVLVSGFMFLGVGLEPLLNRRVGAHP
ncbi:MAG TPA: ABC transporter permease [Egibacteraceae bacterium]|nr:ABC transporter permease [Egibacteraceae bacterium]